MLSYGKMLLNKLLANYPDIFKNIKLPNIIGR